MVGSYKDVTYRNDRMNYKAAILTKKVAAPAAKEEEGLKEAVRTYRIPSYYVEDADRYRVFSEEEADYLDRCSPSDRERVITLLKSGKLRIDWGYDDDDDEPPAKAVTKKPKAKATLVSRKGSVKA
jgi:hypothetical protein